MAACLTPKQEQFVEAYLRLQSGRKAYKEVYDKTGKMKDHVAEQSASRMLRLVKVSDALKARKEAIEKLNPVCTVGNLILLDS